MRNLEPTRYPPPILVAVDPFDLDREAAERVGQGLRSVFGSDIPDVRPVYVLTPDATVLPSGWFDQAAPRLKADAAARIDEVFYASSVRVTRPEVLLDDRGSHRATVDTLSGYARWGRAPFVVVPTVRKAPLRRLIAGSFSEAMLHFGEVPMLSINVEDRHPLPERRKVLAAVDTASANHLDLADRVIDMAKAHDLEIVFFEAVRADAGRAAKRGERLARRAKLRGVSATSVTASSEPSIPRAILRAAEREGVGLVAVASRATPLRSLVARSVTRALLRTATIPVWALPTRGVPQAEAAPGFSLRPLPVLA